MPAPLLPDEQPDIVPVGEAPASYKLRTRWTHQCKVPWQEEPFTVDIPAGFVMDGMSIPRAAWSVAGLYPDGLHRAADLVHDWCYQHQGNVFGTVLNRRQADDLHKSLYTEAGGSANRVTVVYDAIRAFGWIFWNKLHLSNPKLDPRTVTYAAMMSENLFQYKAQGSKATDTSEQATADPRMPNA